MFYKILLSIFLAAFISACSTKPTDTADTSGSGSSATASIDPASGDADILADLINTPLGVLEQAGQLGQSVEPGSQEDLIVNVGDRVFFSYNSAELDDDAKELLQDQVAWLKQYSNVSVIIEGHCDERGTREYNLALGEKRAQSVKNYLISLGISSDRVSTISYGKERPAVVGSNDGAWAQNRRSVTIVN